MSRRIREAMRSGALAPMGGAGSIVEVDETFIGQKLGAVKKRGYGHKNAVLSLADPIITAKVAKETAMMTGEAGQNLTQ